MPKGGLEPPRVASHAPQTCASASSATSAKERFSKVAAIIAGNNLTTEPTGSQQVKLLVPPVKLVASALESALIQVRVPLPIPTPIESQSDPADRVSMRST